jgi:Tfp pilus assembly protein PilO
LIDAKRVAYLLIMALVLGVGLVYLQTSRYQMVDELIGLREDEQQIRQEVRGQQVELSRRMQNPEEMRQMLALYQIPVLAPGQERLVEEEKLDLARTE